ncbi:glycine dehydrogenase subunit 1 [Natronocella acetinitrilica]|uniref:Probable glycine dehydrogenase (decarboxylating) subunit 1 n=1 Tax=Natronocella acetinitrilica TaxID=414046 RepID=A0AAE3GAP8_9GAMM|nr:aminomethyl-transferring glycine dehydrogenase subunit GcvPA [Natronocella acetinitrilica]MCP1676812.1 glycine dehydrogenase subunit 1 [Natronocella acetinitrilica]
MPFIPHTDDDIRHMLDTIGVADINALFDEIPEPLRGASLDGLPAGLPEQTITRLMRERARQDEVPLCFIGAGAYRHHVPAAVWELTTRGEYYSAYTPYQAEASQGTLQLLYEYQSMMAGLTGMDVSNASLYDGATAVAEAILMAVRANRRAKSRRVFLAGTLHPIYRDVIRAIVDNQGIELDTLPLPEKDGALDVSGLDDLDEAAAVVIQQPNFYGRLEAVDALTDAAHAAGAMVIAVVNPLALALLKPPGQWGSKGVDIACGEGQPMGIPLSSGGPYFGFLCTRKAHVRQMPGRVIGRTVDLDGKTGYTLTLQAREQHIRRSKATSNICTNQGLMVTAATIHMSLLGAEGLRRVAIACHEQTNRLVAALTEIPGVEAVHSGPVFHERLLRLPTAAAPVLETLAGEGILGGYDLGRHDSGRERELLVCATEVVTDEDIAHYAARLRAAVAGG